ncbi:MAG TPA: prolyl oligopeptidase family serine peptidase [Candidatus Udaeobacter sp.]|jgi:dipeptidyl aminopeptidase/acylaminoacyl peptidase|nr:prolyl oligopeptidase family serine peptidase [Candidatus Udaeobacter sp.]
MRAETEQKMRRWREQRWLLDQVIQTRGLDWDQGRTAKILRNCGPSAQSDIQEISRRVQKFVDIPREFSRAAARREALARESEEAGHLVNAREHYYIAATFYTNALWAIYEEGNEKRELWAERKRACYDKFIEHAGRRIERVELPYEGKSIAALLHLPNIRADGDKIPCVLYIPGMDGVKEDTPMYNDPLLERGVAVLAIDGPGQGETRERGIKCTASNYEDAGKLACDYLVKRTEIDPTRLAIMGSSMGSYWGPRVAAVEPRFRACAVSGVNVEPGQNTIFNSASPTFKLNYMYMAGYDDEAAFDEFAKTLTLKRVTSKIRCPYLVVAGEDDDLCPIEFVYEFMEEISGPKVLVVYEGEKHSIRNPRARMLLVDWLADRLSGKPFKSEKIYVEMSGKELHSDW